MFALRRLRAMPRASRVDKMSVAARALRIRRDARYECRYARFMMPHARRDVAGAFTRSYAVIRQRLQMRDKQERAR